MRIDVVTLTHGSRRYGETLDLLRADPKLPRQLRRDAGSYLSELGIPETTLTVVFAAGQPAAWCAATVLGVGAGRVLKCHSNYERRGPGRELGLYRLVYQTRHEQVVLPSGLNCITYLYPEPIPLHEADGWYRTGLTDTAYEPGVPRHVWAELRRDA